MKNYLEGRFSHQSNAIHFQGVPSGAALMTLRKLAVFKLAYEENYEVSRAHG